MAQVQTTSGDVYVSGNISCGSFTPPAGCIGDGAVVANAQIAATKLQCQPSGLGLCAQLFGPTTSVAALTQTLFIANAAGTLVQFGALVSVVATGADRTITIDLKSNGGSGSSFSTVLSATVGFTNGSTAYSLVTGTFSAAAYTAGTVFQTTVAVAGSAAAQATGLLLKLLLRENSQ